MSVLPFQNPKIDEQGGENRSSISPPAPWMAFDLRQCRSPNKMRSITRAAFRPYVCPSCRHGIGAGRRQFRTQAAQSAEIYDVVCVGGGPAGLGLLAALRTSYILIQLVGSGEESLIDILQVLHRSPQSLRSPSSKARTSARPVDGTSTPASSPTESAA